MNHSQGWLGLFGRGHFERLAKRWMELAYDLEMVDALLKESGVSSKGSTEQRVRTILRENKPPGV